jgi:hypothetical protein
MMTSNFKSNHRIAVLGRSFPWPCRGREVRGFLAVVVLSAFVIIGCGGGSSGTGENDVSGIGASEGQIVDASCKPVSGVDLSSLGLGTAQDVSGDDGSFTLDPKTPQQVPAPPGVSSPELDRSQANCIVIVYENGRVVSSNVYPLADIPECSIEGLPGSVTDEDLPLCGDRQK